MTQSRTNQEWLDDLSASSVSQEAAISDLREILLRAALYFFGKNQADFGNMSRDEIIQRAEDCAQDALIAVLKHLSDFRGDSKFSTWAYKFAINIALMAARRERWKEVSFDELIDKGEGMFLNWGMTNKSVEAAPEESAMQAELQSVIRNVIESELTAKQRQVLLLMVFNEVPMDEAVRYLGTNRNAVYKLLHDARRKFKSSLEAQGYDLSEMLALFSPQG